MGALRRSRPAVRQAELPGRVQPVHLVPVREPAQQVRVPVREPEQEPELVPLQVRAPAPGFARAEVVQPPVALPEVGAESALEEKE